MSQKVRPSPSPSFPQSGKVRKKLTMLFLSWHWTRGPNAAEEEVGAGEGKAPPPQAEKLPWLAKGRGGGRFWDRGERRALKTFSL